MRSDRRSFPAQNPKLFVISESPLGKLSFLNFANVYVRFVRRPVRALDLQTCLGPSESDNPTIVTETKRASGSEHTTIGLRGSAC